MNKKIIFLISIFTFLFFVSPAQAKEYSINSLSTQATVNKDGSMEIESQRLYDFEGSFSYAYIYYNKIPGQNSGRTENYQLTDFKVCDKQGCYQKVSSPRKSFNTSSESLKSGTF